MVEKNEASDISFQAFHTIWMEMVINENQKRSKTAVKRCQRKGIRNFKEDGRLSNLRRSIELMEKKNFGWE